MGGFEVLVAKCACSAMADVSDIEGKWILT
jgi:hypothetical protein